VVLVGFGYFLGQLPMSLALYIQINKYPELGGDAFSDFQANPDFTVFHIDQNLGFLLILLIFVFAISGLFFGLKSLHRRNILSLVNWSEKIDWSRVFWGLGFWLFIGIITEVVMYLSMPSNYAFSKPGWSFLILILISFIFLPIQTSFEEFLFRGYFMQAIGYFSKNKLLALLLTTFLFVLVHSMNPEIKEYGLWNMIPYYAIAGLFLGFITIMDDRLELAIGVHAATNIFGALFVSYKGAALQTGSLFQTNTVNPLFLALVFLCMAVIFIIVASKRFGWNSPAKAFSTLNEKELRA
jgi:membrane protease YdiL (CAAX protease family)